ncbi:hypothetical protein D3C80_597780 [compost metagenome]
MLRAGKLTITGKADYSGLTDVARGAELRVTGELKGNVSVKGKLVNDGNVNWTVKVATGELSLVPKTQLVSWFLKAVKPQER